MKARIRQDLIDNGDAIPVLEIMPNQNTAMLQHLWTEEIFDYEQPNILEDQEYTAIIKWNGSVFLAMAIDLEFIEDA